MLWFGLPRPAPYHRVSSSRHKEVMVPMGHGEGGLFTGLLEHLAMSDAQQF